MNSNTSHQYPHPTYAWTVVVVLLLATICSFIDRMILALLVEPIKGDLGLSDTQIGILHGFAFAAFYALMGLPIGRIADRVNRRNVIVIGIASWSVMTASCGLARNFATMFLARMGTAIGEATLSPCAYPLIADYFPKEKRSTPMSLVAVGPYFGGGLSFVLGGIVLAWVAGLDPVSIPWVGALKPWQLTFMIVGLPGIAIAAIVWLIVREPVRHERIATDDQGLPWSETFKYAWLHRKVFLLITAGASFNVMIAYALNGWTPTLFIRLHGWDAAQIGTIFGLIYMTFGSIGTFMGGYVGDWLYRRGRMDAYIRTMLIFIPGAMALAVMPLVSSPELALVLLAIGLLFLATGVALPITAILQVSPNEFRGQMLAMYFFLLYVLGVGFGPVVVALLTDYLFQDTNAIGYSIALVAAITIPCNVAALWLCLKPYGRLLRQVHGNTAG